MLNRILLSLSVAPFGLMTPLLEIGPTHVLNPAWPGHARLHEVWQLGTNSALALLCLWLAWQHGAIRLASLIGLFVTGGFLAALACSSLYGGTMRHSDGSEFAIGGINLAVAIMMLAAVCLTTLIVRDGVSNGASVA